MAQPNPEVSKMFGRYLRVWQDALSRWITKCKGVQEERRTLRVTGGLVAEAAPGPHRRSMNPTVSDAAPVPKSSGLSSEAEERLRQLDSKAARCDAAIREIHTVIARLREAMKTGVWDGQQLWTGFRKQPKFTGGQSDRISRGEHVIVLELKGDWWRVRNESGVEGWVHQGEMAPRLPIELSADPGGPPRVDEITWSAGRG